LGDEGQSEARTDIVPLRRGIVPRKPARQLEQAAKGSHQRYDPTKKAHPGWSSYSSQASIRSVHADAARGLLWMATWGGVLCWDIDGAVCTRHTSEHGLIGNAVSVVAVDANGRVWASGESGGLAWLDFEARAPWREHPGCAAFVIRRMVSGDRGGVIAACDDCVLQVLDLSIPSIKVIPRQVATRHVQALTADGAGGFWTGNAWGLHHVAANGEVHTCELVTDAVTALARAPDGGLWIGTSAGLFRLPAGSEILFFHEEWPRSAVKWLSVDAADTVWVSAEAGCGRVTSQGWEPEPQVAECNPDGWLECARGQVFSIGPQAVYRLAGESLEVALGWTAEDAAGNAVQCFCAQGERLWAGCVGGLAVLQSGQWQVAASSELRDIRALMPHEEGRLWAGSMRAGLRLLDGLIDVPGDFPGEPIVALCAGADGRQWAASPHVVFVRAPRAREWLRIETGPAGTEGAVIQTLHYRQAEGRGVLLVGTSAGLWSYRPDLGLWEPVPGPWDGMRIRAVAQQGETGPVWIGTAHGLFSLNARRRVHGGDVRAILFEEATGGPVWLGTADGLEQWALPQGRLWGKKPDMRLRANNSGLAGTLVTALTLREIDGRRELWVGSLAGPSCLRRA
jgi:ligand-binding sensor domain-containing protein